MQDQMTHHEQALAADPVPYSGRNGGGLTVAGRGPYSGQSLSDFSVYSS